MGVVVFRSVVGARKPDPIESPAIPPDARAKIQHMREGYCRLWERNPSLARFVLDWLLVLLARQGCL